MSDRATCSVIIDGMPFEVDATISVAAALMNAGLHIRRSVTGEPRAALCGMGVCHECRVTIDGERHRRACLTAVAAGQVITRDE